MEGNLVPKRAHSLVEGETKVNRTVHCDAHHSNGRDVLIALGA